MKVKSKRIKHNKIQCRRCSHVIESKSVHDFVTCPCGAVSVDGGKEYLRRVGTPDYIREMSEFE